ncbi:MAG: hypothetical protein ACJAUG_003201 [Halioglobus sp.]|jgi:hypothetical protein
MNAIDYSSAPYPVRSNFDETHNRFWNRLASPGAWLSGAQKVAIAKEIRAAQGCTLCKARKEALSPYQVAGTHEIVSDELSEAMVEVVHRIVTDSARLTKKWFDDIVAQGLTPQEYVEILGTIVHTFAIDEFCRGLGIPLNELPEPLAGAPTRYLPENATYDAEAWVPLLPNFIEEGAEADLWNGFGANVIRALSLVPDEVRSLIDLFNSHYITNDSIVGDWTICPHGGLTRIEMEIIATRVSSHNDCFY